MKSKSEFTLFILIIGIIMFKAFSAMSMSLETDSTKNAGELIAGAERAVALIVKSGQATTDKALKRSNKSSDPFWASVKKLNSNIDKLNKYHFLKDETFHKTLAESVTAKEEVITTYEMLEANDKGVSEGITKASTAIDLLYENYSKEALRMKSGKALNPQEKEQLAKLKTQNKELNSKLDELEKKVDGNEKMIKKIKKIRSTSNEVMHCNNNAAGFFFAMSAMNMMNGWMWGCHYWWGPYGGWYPGFYVGYVDIYVDIMDDYAYDWGYLDGAIDTYDYDLEVEMDDLEIDTMDEYLDEIEVGDYMNDYNESMIEDAGFPSQMDHMQPEMELQDYQELQQFDQPEMMDDFGDFDMGGFDAGGFDDW